MRSEYFTQATAAKEVQRVSDLMEEQGEQRACVDHL